MCGVGKPNPAPPISLHGNIHSSAKQYLHEHIKANSTRHIFTVGHILVGLYSVAYQQFNNKMAHWQNYESRLDVEWDNYKVKPTENNARALYKAVKFASCNMKLDLRNTIDILNMLVSDGFDPYVHSNSESKKRYRNAICDETMNLVNKKLDLDFTPPTHWNAECTFDFCYYLDLHQFLYKYSKKF